MAGDPDPIVYSTDGSHLRACAACGRHPCACPAPEEVVPAGTVLRLRLERQGRRGKTVTVVSDLPPDPAYFGRLVRALKTHCGVGGALTGAGMELQGDQRDRAQAYLEQLGFTVRRVGG
ncbi:MAG: translation initiation factor [Candidatus Lambdaproteobacteria bacterium]|nr:translation initiation factor [Candidatus Lambdaproteobacteria bacterium]